MRLIFTYKINKKHVFMNEILGFSKYLQVTKTINFKKKLKGFR
jgi:hypothetical protein